MVMWYVQNQSRLTKLFRMQREILNIQSVLVTHKLVDQDDIVARIGVILVELQIASEMLPTVEHSCENASVVVVNLPKRYGEESIGLFY